MLLVKFLVSVIRLYQRYRPYKTPNCRFHPTCSEYMVQALEKYGFLKGISLGLRRIMSCHPWGKHGYDPLD